MKLSIVYDTRSGNTAHMAEYIIEGMRQVEGVEARAFDLDAVDEQYVRESAALIVGTPTYNGTFTARLKGWLESAPSKLKLAGKLGGAYGYGGVHTWRWRCGDTGNAYAHACGWNAHLFKRCGVWCAGYTLWACGNSARSG